MARPAPAVDRTVRVLDFLAARPGERFSLSELARRLDVSKATLHALLARLVDAGYLLRQPGAGTYGLGPALIALGDAALAGYSAVDYARDEMRAISDELGLQCLASAAVDDEIVVLVAAGVARPLEVSVRPGARLPLDPPLGTVFVAWAGPEAVEGWLDRRQPPLTAAERERYRAILAVVRSRGYAVGLEAGARRQLAEAMAGRGGDVGALLDQLAHEESILMEVEPTAASRVNHVAAPVFGADGRVELALTLVGFDPRTTADRLVDHGERLRAAAFAVTKAIRGRAPDQVDDVGDGG